VNPVNVTQRRIEAQFELAIAVWSAYHESIIGRKIVLDIGANVGGMFKSFIENGVRQVHAFEPVPSAYARMVADYGDDARLIPSMVGMSDKPGRITKANVYNTWTLLPEQPHIDLATAFKGSPPFDFELTTVDLYCSASNVKPDFIKIDVDGYELRVLKGAVETLAKFRPPILFELSFLPSLIGDNCEELCKLIFELGYIVVTMDGKTKVCNWLDLIERFPWRSSFDVMLIPKERL
jgi:FkbM family methyltransferase